MAKIEMIRRNRVFSVDARLAPLLEAHGGYQRRDMQAQPAAAPFAAADPAATSVAVSEPASASVAASEPAATSVAVSEPEAASVAASEPAASDLVNQQMHADDGKATRKAAKSRNGAAAPKTAPAKDEI